MRDMTPFERHMSAVVDAAFTTTTSRVTDASFGRAPTIDDIASDIRAAVAKLALPPMQIRESLLMTDTVEDWSGVRSPSRAIRRRRRGFRQNIKVKHVPKSDGFVIDGVVYVHPVTLALARAQLRIAEGKQ